MEHLQRARHLADLVLTGGAGDLDPLLARSQPGHLSGHRPKQAADGLVDIALRHQRDQYQRGGDADPHEQQGGDEVCPGTAAAGGILAQQPRNIAPGCKHVVTGSGEGPAACACFLPAAFEGGDPAAEVGDALANVGEPRLRGRIGPADCVCEHDRGLFGLGQFVECGPGACRIAADHHDFGVVPAFAQMGDHPLCLEREGVGLADPSGAAAELDETADREQSGGQCEAEAEREEEGDLAADRETLEPAPQRAHAAGLRRRYGDGSGPGAVGFEIEGNVLHRAHAAASPAWVAFCSSIRRSISVAGSAR